MTHVIESRDQTTFGWCLTCSCGKEFKHRDPVGAERLFEYHAGLESARNALNKGRTG